MAGGIGKSVPRTLFAHVQIPRARDKKTGKQKKLGLVKYWIREQQKDPLNTYYTSTSLHNWGSNMLKATIQHTQWSAVFRDLCSFSMILQNSTPKAISRSYNFKAVHILGDRTLLVGVLMGDTD